MFKQLAIMITVTLLASLFTALTFSPMLCAKLLTVMPHEVKDKEKSWSGKFYETSGKFFDLLDNGYARLLGWSLKHKKTTILYAIIIFALSVLLVFKIGTEFIPEEDTGDLNVSIQLPVGTRVEQTDKVARQVEQVFRSNVPEMQTLFSRVGQSSVGRFGAAFGARMGPNVMEIGTKLLSVDKRKRSVKEIAQSIRPKISSLVGVKKIDIRAGSPFSRILFGGGKPISIEIFGNDLEATDNIAYKLKNEISQIRGVTDATISRELGQPELQVEVDRLKASSLGLSMSTITDTLRIYFYGKTASKYREAGEEYDIFVRLKDSDRTSIKDIEDIPVVSPSGKIIRLSNVAKIIHRTGPIEIERQNQERIVKVEANTFQRSLGDVAKDIRGLINSIQLPPEVTINLGSDVEEQAKSFRDLFLLFILGGILVYMVMAAQFESLLDPFIVIFSVPFAFTGVAFGLFLGNITLSVISFLGLVMLVGIVVNNAIVLVDYINILRSRGLSMQEAVTTGGANRLRPILMTTITTLFGMLPLAISRGEGSELWRPLGVSMIGGLSLSTLITLVLVPVMYAILKEGKLKPKRRSND
jgi:HAE1 family hydrophobic/amphiphilic exporter-1